MIDLILVYLGAAILVIGGILNVIAAIGFFKFKEFYTRLHAATIATIGGGFYPLIGIAIMVLGLDIDVYMKAVFAGVSFITALLVALGVPAGSHILARAVYRSGEAKPMVSVDRLKEDLEKGDME